MLNNNLNHKPFISPEELTMSYNEFFYLIFAGQILIISVFIARWTKNRVVQLLADYPPAEYPKLYPVSVARIKTVLHTFSWLNLLMVLIGIGILVASAATDATELLHWDTQAVLVIYFLLQYLPFLFLGTSNLKYHQLMRSHNPSPKRQAQLSRRSVSDFASAWLLKAAIASLMLYVLTVVYVQQNPFPGFVGYWNILFVLLLNVFFAVMIQYQIKGKKLDPHQSHQDRMNQTALVVKLLLVGLIACHVFMITNLFLSLLDLRHISDMVQSLYFSLIALMMGRTTVYEAQDYEVYQAEAD